MIAEQKHKLYTYYITFIFLISISPVISAYVAQYIFHIYPCKLCIYQRIPYIALAFISFIFLVYRRLSQFLDLFATYSIITFLINVALSFFNIGVEKKWFHYQSGCTSNFSAIESVDQLKNVIVSSDIVLCDQERKVFLDLSFAGWNFIYSLICLTAIITMYVYMRKHAKQ